MSKRVKSGGLGRLGWCGTAAVALAAVGVVGIVGAGCGSSSKAPPTPECVLNSDCLKFQPPGLVCALGFCVKPCNISSDCPNNERCVIVGGDADAGADSGAGGAGATGGSAGTKDGGTAVASLLGTACQAPETVLCHYTSDCKAPLVCGADQECRNQCQSNVDCAGYNNQSDPQVCTVNTHLCADPMVDKDYDPVTMDFRTLDAGSSGGGGSGGNGGGNGGHGGATASCAAGLAGFHPSNLPTSLTIPTGLSTITQAADATFDTDLLTFDSAIGPDGGAPPVAMKITLGDGRQAAALFFQSYTLATDVTLSVTGELPLIIVANGTMNIQGTITTAQSPSDQWYGGGAPGPATPGRSGQCGLNSCSGGGQPGATTRALEMGSGGGAFCGLGGAGSTLGPDAGVPAAGGMAYGVPELVPLVGGASGGSGISAVNQMNHGGGAIELVAGTSLTIDSNAIIDMGGGADSEAYAIGGGSGGGILLEAPTVNLKGALVAAGASGSSYESAGQNGGPSLTGAPGGATYGGIGSSATSINGGNGTAASPGDFGGGGGGAGRIRINTGCGGALNINSSALLTPGATTPCYTVGTLN